MSKDRLKLATILAQIAPSALSRFPEIIAEIDNRDDQSHMDRAAKRRLERLKRKADIALRGLRS